MKEENWGLRSEEVLLEKIQGWIVIRAEGVQKKDRTGGRRQVQSMRGRARNHRPRDTKVRGDAQVQGHWGDEGDGRLVQKTQKVLGNMELVPEKTYIMYLTTTTSVVDWNYNLQFRAERQLQQMGCNNLNDRHNSQLQNISL